MTPTVPGSAIAAGLVSWWHGPDVATVRAAEQVRAALGRASARAAHPAGQGRGVRS